MAPLPQKIINNRSLLEEYAKAIISNVRIAVLDKNCKIIWVNERFCRLTKYKEEELLGQSISHLNLVCDDTELFNNVLSLLSRGLKWSGEVKSQSKDGFVFWVKTQILPINGDNGEVDSYLVFSSDITPIKTALKEKDAVLEELMRSEARYRALVENQSDLISLCDARGIRIFVNSSYCQFFGKSYDELIGTDIRKLPLSGLPDDVISRILQLKPDDPEITGILPLKNAVGKSFWISIRIKGIFDNTNNLFEILTIGRDVTNLKNAELDKGKYIEDFERVAFMTSHNVRGPIATMLGFLELMRMNAIESEQWNSVLRDLIRCINDLDHYTRELGNFIYQRQSSQVRYSPGTPDGLFTTNR